MLGEGVVSDGWERREKGFNRELIGLRRPQKEHGDPCEADGLGEMQELVEEQREVSGRTLHLEPDMRAFVKVQNHTI